MGILSRFKDIVSANINDMLDKCENPEKMVDEYLRKAIDDLAEVKKETASVMAAETRAKRELDECKTNIEKYGKLAEKAIMAENDGDARVFLAKKQEFENSQPTLQSAYDIAHDNSEKMRQMHDKLTNDIEGMKARRNTVKAQMAVAKTQERINNAKSAGDKISGSMGAFARMEEKAQKRLDEASAMEQLNKSPADDLKDAESRYTGVNSSSVDDELAALKAKLGK